jgi:hypothetical protein
MIQVILASAKKYGSKILLVLSLSSLYLPPRVFGQSLSLAFELDKHSYLKCEEIYFAFFLTNNGSRGVRINYPYLTTGSLRLLVSEAKGHRFEYTGRADGKGKLELGPQESKYELNSLFWYGEQDEENREYHYFRPGSYTVRAVYAPFDDPNDTIISSAWRFTVSEATGDEQAPFNLTLKSNRLSWLMEKNYAEIVSSLTTLIQQYPHSVYRPTALHWLSYVFRRNNEPAKADSIARMLFEIYPNSIMAGRAAQVVSREMSMRDKIEFWGQLRARYGGTQLSKAAQISIEILKKQR